MKMSTVTSRINQSNRAKVFNKMHFKRNFPEDFALRNSTHNWFKSTLDAQTQNTFWSASHAARHRRQARARPHAHKYTDMLVLQLSFLRNKSLYSFSIILLKLITRYKSQLSYVCIGFALSPSLYQHCTFFVSCHGFAAYLAHGIELTSAGELQKKENKLFVCRWCSCLHSASWRKFEFDLK